MVKELSGDSSIQLIDVHLVDAVLQPLVLGLEPFDGLVVEQLFVKMALAERRRNELEDFVVKPQAPEHFSKPLFENLLANVRLVALPLVARAVVVDVFLFLEFAN
ncbi:MAG: hypothetical protein OSA98_15780 [Rubripirellula sp.]|nr:hypothetical protein [Rubripirellula sp.]